MQDLLIDPTARAFRAWFRHADRHGLIPTQPANTSGVVHHDGQDYVVLENVNGILAVYLVAASGRIKRLDDWPSDLQI